MEKNFHKHHPIFLKKENQWQHTDTQTGNLINNKVGRKDKVLIVSPKNHTVALVAILFSNDNRVSQMFS